TSGEIRIAVAPFFLGSIARRAERAFRRLGMSRTQHHNGVLIFVAPSRRQFRILGDAAIHACVGQAHWDRVAAELGRSFAAGKCTEGLVAAVEAVGRELALHFPPPAGDNPDELPDGIAKG
ncbi:MAG TPA: TPM domain-containing protein, partial [Holophaga sp.]|nr:TPM domain-containing protein [Holophaga sp.]